MLEGFSILLLVPVVESLSGTEAGDRRWAAISDLAEGFSESEWLLGLGIAFAILITLRFAVLLMRDLLLARLEHGFVSHIRTHHFSALSAMSWDRLRVLRHGAVEHALSRNIDRAASAVGAALRGAVALVMLAAYCGIALGIAPGVTSIVMAAAALLFIGVLPLRRRANRLGQELTETDYRLFSSVSSFIDGLKPAKAHSLEGSYLELHRSAAESYRERTIAFRRDLSIATLTLQSGAALLAIRRASYGAPLVRCLPQRYWWPCWWFSPGFRVLCRRCRSRRAVSVGGKRGLQVRGGRNPAVGGTLDP